jgi:glycosyltransferase involved in cell wall biosynthesis
LSRVDLAAVMAVYNQRATIAEALDSVLAQTRLPDEIIVVDDGSTDGSGDLVAQRYGSRVQLIRQPNRGAAAARNTGVRAANAAMIAFIDSDDKWFPQYLERQTAVMERNPLCMLSFTAHILHNEATKKTRVENDRLDKGTYLQKYFIRERGLPATDAVMVRRAVFDEVGWFDEDSQITFDTDMWLRIMVRFGFEYVPEPLVWVRRGPHQTTPTDLDRVFKWHDKYFRKHRYTFGRGLRGQAVWRAGYASVLRGHANWYFRNRHGRKAVGQLLKAVCIWPFFNPKWVMKSGAEYLLGPRIYETATAALHRLLRRG